MKNEPYVYYVKNLTTGLKYIGVRFSRKCNPNDFWVTYFTSSKLIRMLINLYGKNDFEYRILKKFDDEFIAQKFERHLLELAVMKPDYVNLHVNFISTNSETYYLNKEKKKRIAFFIGKLQAVRKTGFFGFTTEEKINVSSMGGIAAAKINKENNTGIFNIGVRERQHETLKRLQISAYYDPKLKKEISSKGGKVGFFSKTYYEKNNIPENERIEAQRRRGVIGGSKNAGFVWYNDGNSSFKYTKKQQEIVKFEEFLMRNNNFKKGRVKKIF